MRITQVIPALSLLALAGCSKADAAPVDPNDDFDCAITAKFFHEAAKLQGSPDNQRHALLVLNQWYALKWKDEHPGELAKQGGHAEEVGNALAKNLLDCTGALKTCTDRAIANPKFIRFADLMKNAPDTD